MVQPGAAFGDFRLYAIETGEFWLDGGAMFGVIPKSLWTRKVSADDRNRIKINNRCLLIHSLATDRRYLVDTGIGNKSDERFAGMYAMDFSKHTLLSSLDRHGFTPEDITDVIFTHMHFDHCGGAVIHDSDGALKLLFDQAEHWVHRAHWEHVLAPNELEKASYLPDNIDPLQASGKLRFVENDHEYEPGFEIDVVHGHTTAQQLPLLRHSGQSLLYGADLLPTAAHLHLPWIMAFDIRPLETLNDKKRVFGRCVREKTLVFLEHDPDVELLTITESKGRFAVDETFTLSNL